MNLKHFQYVTAIAELRNLSAAAQKLYITQPALSHMLKQIEDEVGLPLFDRNRKYMKLTPAGERYLSAAQEMICIQKNLLRDLAAMKNEEYGEVIFGAPSQLAIQTFPKTLPLFRQQYPHVNLRLVEKNSELLTASILNGSIDLALVSTPFFKKGISYHFVQKVNLVLLSGRETALAKTHQPGTPIHITEAKDEKFISLVPGQSTRTMQDQLFLEYHIQPEIIFTTKSVYLSQLMTAAMQGVTVCSSSYVRKTPEIAECTYIYPIKDYETPNSLYLCHLQNASLPRYTLDLMEYIRQTLSGSAPNLQNRQQESNI